MKTATRRKAATPRPVTLSDRISRDRATMLTLASEAKVVVDGLNRMIGVCHGANPGEDYDQHQHRVRSVTGRTRTVLKGMARFLEQLREFEATTA